MSENKLGQEPAFPISSDELDYNEKGLITMPYNGMSKRFYAACAAMQGLVSNETYLKGAVTASELAGIALPKWVCMHAYGLADELLKQENK